MDRYDGANMDQVKGKLWKCNLEVGDDAGEKLDKVESHQEEANASKSSGMSYQCQLCSKSFGRLQGLERHLRTHTGERPHHCQLCSKSFSQSGNLNAHMRTHTGERPHQCQHCSRSFGRLGNLKRHIRSHATHGHILTVDPKKQS